MNNKLLEFFQSRNKDKNHNNKPSKKIGYLIIIGLVGLLFLIISNVFSNNPRDDQGKENMSLEQENSTKQANTSDSTSTSEVDVLEASYQEDLEAMLEQIQGVSEVKVMVNLDSTNVKVYERNLIIGQQTTDENDKNGGVRKIEEQTEETQVVLVRQGDKETALLIQTKKPEVRGVFVIANGVEQATVKQWIVEAVSRVLDVPTHRVSVLPRK